jgi:hypothetical protein
LLIQVVDPANDFVPRACRSCNEHLVLDGSKAFYAFFRSCSLKDAEAHLRPENLVHFLGSLAHVTVDLINGGGASVDVASEWQGQATSMFIFVTARCSPRASNVYIALHKFERLIEVIERSIKTYVDFETYVDFVVLRRASVHHLRQAPEAC